MKKGAIGCLVYSDPFQVARYGTLPSEFIFNNHIFDSCVLDQTFVNTDKMPPHAVQRGTVYVGLGDPRTPAFPSIANLYKEKTEEEVIMIECEVITIFQLWNEKMIPTIPVLPIPYSDAQVLFEKLEGKEVTPDFKGIV